MRGLGKAGRRVSDGGDTQQQWTSEELLLRIKR